MTPPGYPAVGTPSASEATSTQGGLGRALDFVSDWSVLAYATWTLIAYGGMVTHARVSVLISVWIAAVPLLAIGLVVLHRGPDRLVPNRAGLVERAAALELLAHRRLLVASSLGAAFASAVIAAAARDALWPLVWVLALVAVALAVPLAPLRSSAGALSGWMRRPAADVFAALAGLSLATMSLFISRSSADDVYYVNRATATAELNRIPVRDVIVTNQQAPPASGVGLPVDTFSALQGALGRLFGVHAASVAYYVTPPLFTFLATWALWRLVRAWAPRTAILCFALGCAYWLFSAQLNLTAGSYFLARMWQGKVIFVAWLVPTLYVYLTRWLERRGALVATLLLAGGVSSIGMTGSASFVAPLLFGAAALPLVDRRDWRGLPVLVAAAGIPFLIGLVATLKYPLADLFLKGRADSTYVYDNILGFGVVAAVGAIALWSAPWLAESARAARLTSAIGIVAVLLLAPGVLAAIGDVAGLTSSLRRTLWILPLPALVGLLAAVPPGWLRPRAAAAVPAVLVAALLVAFGRPVWTSESGNSLWTSRPGWKTNQTFLAEARAILKRYDGTGPILARKGIMAAIALVTANPKAVNPRVWYVRLIREPGDRTAERLRLMRFVMREKPEPTPRQVRHDLADLRVGLVCLPGSSSRLIVEVQEAAPYRETFRTHGQLCLERRPPTQAADRPRDATTVLQSAAAAFRRPFAG